MQFVTRHLSFCCDPAPQRCSGSPRPLLCPATQGHLAMPLHPFGVLSEKWGHCPAWGPGPTQGPAWALPTERAPRDSWRSGCVGNPLSGPRAARVHRTLSQEPRTPGGLAWRELGLELGLPAAGRGRRHPGPQPRPRATWPPPLCRCHQAGSLLPPIWLSAVRGLSCSLGLAV